MASGLVILVDPSDPASTAGLPPSAWPAALERQTYRDGRDAVEALRQLRSGDQMPAAVVIRGEPKPVLATARQVHALDPQVQMIFLANAEEAARLREAMGLAPRIGTYWTIIAPGADELPRLLLEATRSTHQRRHLRTTLDRARLQVAAPPPANAPDYRRLVLSDRYLAAILTHARDAILSVDRRGRILTANQSATELTGHATHDLLGQSLPALVAEQEQAAVESMLGAVREGAPEVRRELRLRCRDAILVDVDIMLAPIRDENERLLGISAILRDIRERKRAEAALREQQEWLRVTLRSIGDAVIATDTEGRVTFLNPVASILTGWNEQDAVGRPLEEVFVIINEHSRNTLEHPAAKVLREGAVVGLANHTVLIARDGTERPIDDSAAPIRDAAGTLLGVVLVFHDISERRRIERQLQERTDRLAESDRRKDEFLALLGHELRNPLAPLRNGLQVLELQEDADPELTGEVRTMMERQVDQLVRLVDDLLDVSRINRGVLQLRRERVELKEIIHRAVETTRPALEERQHQLTLHLPDELVWLDADPVRLEQIFCNLLTNASRYTEPGGTIRIESRREGRWAAVRVIDNGIGIRPEMLPRIFELFTQADRVSGSVHEGLGLGLTLVKSLTDLHGGTIEADSRGPGHGSQFLVRLPVAEQPSASTAEPESTADARRNEALRVLVVDDNRDAAESLAMLLRLTGHEVRLAFDGPAALEVASDYRPELVLLDIGLPHGMDGYEVAKRLRQQNQTPPPLLAALTGFGQDKDRRRAEQAGFDAHLVKPAEARAVHELLARAARRRNASR